MNHLQDSSYSHQSIRLPPIKWAQRKDRVFMIVELRDIKNEQIEWISENTLKISLHSDNKDYFCELEFFGDLKKEVSYFPKFLILQESKWNITGFCMQFNLIKKDSGPYWPRLIKDTKKASNISVDWNKYIDEDEEAEEGDKGLGDWDPDSMRSRITSLSQSCLDFDESDSDDEPEEKNNEGSENAAKINDLDIEEEIPTNKRAAEGNAEQPDRTNKMDEETTVSG